MITASFFMKKLFSIALAGVMAVGCMASQAEARVNVSVNVGGPVVVAPPPPPPPVVVVPQRPPVVVPPPRVVVPPPPTCQGVSATASASRFTPATAQASASEASAPPWASSPWARSAPPLPLIRF